MTSFFFSKVRVSRAFWVTAVVGGSGVLASHITQRLSFGLTRQELKQDKLALACTGREDSLRLNFASKQRANQKSTVEESGFIAALCEAENLFGVSPELLMGLAEVESGFQVSVRSDKGAVGLYQILPATARNLWPYFVRSLPDADPIRRLAPTMASLRDPRVSTLLGAFYLARLGRRYKGNLKLALAAYNVGPTKLNRAMKEGEYPGLRYARRVMSRIPMRVALSN